MAGEHRAVQTSNSYTLHRYAHKMNRVLKNYIDYIKQYQIFFSSLSRFASFLSKSLTRTHALDEIV